MDDENLLYDNVWMARTNAKLLQRIVVSGEPGQLPPIGPGNPLKDLLKTDLPRSRLTKNFRTACLTQASQIEQENAKLLADNLEAMSENKKVTWKKGVFDISDTEETTLDMLFDKYSSVEGLETSQIMTVTNEERIRINLFWMRRMGWIAHNEEKRGGMKVLYVGEKIRFTKNSTDKDFSVMNGTREIIKDMFDTDHAEFFIGPLAAEISPADKAK